MHLHIIVHYSLDLFFSIFILLFIGENVKGTHALHEHGAWCTRPTCIQKCIFVCVIDIRCNSKKLSTSKRLARRRQL